MAMLTLLRRAAQRSTRAVSSSTASFSASPITASTRKRHVAVASASIPQARAVSVDSLFSAPSRVIVTPAYHANDVTGVLAGVAVVSALIGVGKMWWDASSSSPSAVPTRVKDISREEIAQFFMDLKASIAQLFTQLPELDEQFRQHLKSQNVELSEEEYKQTLLQQLLSILQNIEQQVVGARGWDREAFQHALERFADDEEIANLQKELQVIMHSVFPPPEIPSHLTPEKALEILAILTKGMEQAMTEMLKHARAEGITDPAKAMEEFQQIYLDQIEQVTFETMKKHEVSGDIFNIALQKYYGEDPAFRKKVEAIYAEQAAVFRRMGLDVDTN